MKKTYINPTITTVKVVMHQMITESTPEDITIANPSDDEIDAGGIDARIFGGATPGVNIWEE